MRQTGSPPGSGLKAGFAAWRVDGGQMCFFSNQTCFRNHPGGRAPLGAEGPWDGDF